MELDYDRGTLLLRGVDSSPPAPASAESLPKVPPPFVWDPRVAAWRASAHQHPEALAALRRRGWAIVDRVRCSAAASVAIAAGAPIDLRPYQDVALESWHRQGERGLVVLPTGAGKTRVALTALARMRRAAIVLVPTRVLLHQWVARLREVVVGPIGIVGDGHHDVRAVTACTFESAARHGDSFLDLFALLVVDEAHHAAAGPAADVLACCPAAARMGLTATPPDGGGEALADLIGPVACAIQVGDLAGTHLAPLRRLVVEVNLDADEMRRYAVARERWRPAARAAMARAPGDFKGLLRELARTDSGRRALAARAVAERLVGSARAKVGVVETLVHRHWSERVLIFTPDNDVACQLSRHLLVPALTCDVGRGERERLLAGFRAGTVRALVSARVLNEGMDLPEATIAIVVGGRGGRREHVQRVGRVLRPAAGKTALLYEIVARGTHEDQARARREVGLASRRSR